MDSTKLLHVSYADREAYEQVRTYLADTFTGPSKALWEEIDRYYENDHEAPSCDGEVLLSRISRKNEKLGTVLEGVVARFNESISIPNLTQEILEAKKYSVGLELASRFTSAMAKQSDIDELINLYIELSDGILQEEGSAEEADVFEDAEIEDIASAHSKENMFTCYPRTLNEALDGGVPRGTSIAIFARPEVGKSLTAINMAAGFCRTGKRVLYVGNEDPHTEMRLRFISRFSGLRKLDVLRDRTKAIDLARAGGYTNLVFASCKPGTIREIEGLIVRYKPDVLVVDQIRNLAVKAEGLTAILESAANSIRGLGKKYDLVTVQVSQAGDSATNKLVLEMNDVDSSKTGFAAAFDVMIGVGMNGAYEQEGKRMMSLCKNKVSSNHIFFPVGIDPTISKVSSI